MEEFIRKLYLNFEGEYADGKYIVSVDNSNDFSRLFDSISSNPELRLSDAGVASKDKSEFTYSGSKATDEMSDFRFTDGYYEIHLQADYIKDIYSMTVEEK